MAKFDIFVGRKQELGLIDEWAGKRNTTHMIAVQGSGGVGKTWLLRAIQRRYQENKDYIVIYWDYAEHPTTGLPQVAALYGELGIERSRFINDLAELDRTAYDLVPADLEERESQLFQTSIEELAPLLHEKRLIYMVDTTEVMATSTERIDRFAGQLPNVLLISAGRDIQDKRLPSFYQVYGPDNVTCIELQNFYHIESAEFFDAADEEGLIPPDLRDKLHYLTGGRPVLLSLAFQWLSSDVPLPEIAERSTAELLALSEAQLSELRASFEFQLVGRVRQLASPLYRAVLRMAHIHRRSDAHILSVLLDLSLADARALMEQLAELSFVKYNPAASSGMLHDEMRHLINVHAWPYVDPTGDLRRNLTRRVIADYYEPRIAELARQNRVRLADERGPVRRTTIVQGEWEQWRLEAECLSYHLQIDEEEGFAYFDDRFAEAQRNNHLVRMQFLLSEMEVAGHTGIRDTITLRRADTLRRSGETAQAAAICQEMLSREYLSPDNRILAHNTLGFIAAATDAERARKHYESALRLAQEGGKTQFIGELHNNLGQLYRLTSQLDEAVTHYQQAVQASKEAHNLPLVASATNNLAYVYRLQGDLSQADVLCRVALALRKRLGIERDLAYSYLTSGEIDRDRGDLENAERYTKLALRSFDKVSEIRGQITAYRSLANVRRHLAQYEEAEAYIKQGLALAREIGDEPLLASLLNVYGRTVRDRAEYLQRLGEAPETDITHDFQRAETYLERSLELAERYGDRWLITRGHFELVLTYFMSGSRSDDEIVDLLDQVWQSASQLHDLLLQGYAQETRGEVAQRQEDYGTAARQYGRAALLIGRRHGREPDRFFDRLGDRLIDPVLPYEAIRTMAQGILDVLQESALEEPVEESLQSLKMLCQQVLDLQGL
jgi:tetratricopeptide (TPR) repeat protein